MNYENFLKQNPFNFDIKNLNLIQKKMIEDLNNHHYKKCIEYKKIIKNFYGENNSSYFNKMLPINLFKNFELKSISNDQVFKVMLGTSGQKYFLIKIMHQTENYFT